MARTKTESVLDDETALSIENARLKAALQAIVDRDPGSVPAGRSCTTYEDCPDCVMLQEIAKLALASTNEGSD